jgi:hypothetical protein
LTKTEGEAIEFEIELELEIPALLYVLVKLYGKMGPVLC